MQRVVLLVHVVEVVGGGVGAEHDRREPRSLLRHVRHACQCGFQRVLSAAQYAASYALTQRCMCCVLMHDAL